MVTDFFRRLSPSPVCHATERFERRVIRRGTERDRKRSIRIPLSLIELDSRHDNLIMLLMLRFHTNEPRTERKNMSHDGPNMKSIELKSPERTVERDESHIRKGKNVSFQIFLCNIRFANAEIIQNCRRCFRIEGGKCKLLSFRYNSFVSQSFNRKIMHDM